MLSFGIIILSLLVLGILLALLFPIGGTWERVFESGQSIWDRERVVLKQFGFMITGEQVVSGGVQKFFGLALGPSIWLRRRDFGAQGQVLLHLTLKLSPDRLFLKGYATPMRVEFFEVRTYRKAELTPVQQSGLVTVGHIRAEV